MGKSEGFLTVPTLNSGMLELRRNALGMVESTGMLALANRESESEYGMLTIWLSSAVSLENLECMYNDHHTDN